MSELYDSDTLTWSRQQAALLRRVAEGERINDQVDWPNIIEEIESVGREELRAVTSALKVGMQHKLYLLGWPAADAARHWRIEARVHFADAHGDFRESMRQEIERGLPRLYRRALLGLERHMLDAGSPTAPLPKQCPWTLDELLAEGEAAAREAPRADQSS
jgi:hypothetical protein